MNAITRDLRTCPPGQWKVARVNGIIEVITGRPSIEAIREAIGAQGLDSVSLRDPRGRHTDVVMMVDDTGVVTGKQVNPLADELYQAQCVPGNPHHIRGDVAIVNDSDFG